MTVEQLLLIILCVFLAVFLIALILIVYILGRSSVKDNPFKARIFVKTGLHISKPKRAKLTTVNKNGAMYTYGKNVVFVPKTYSEHYFMNCRMIFVKHLGQLVASPFDKDVALSDSESETLIYELCASHIGADGMRALKGGKAANSIIMAVVAFIIGAVLAYGIVNYQSITTQQAEAQTIKTQTQQKIIEVE